MYSYVHNLQGDIVGILDSSGNLVVEYKYNVWGKLVSLRTLTTAYDTLAELNPFRYRGYVWDGEIGLYYLKSRYYNAEFCRMINADSLILLRGIYENNVFAYCVNAPSVFKDPSGNHFQKVFQKISGFVNWLKKAIADVSEKVNEYIDNLPEITIGEVNYYKTHTELTIFVDRKIDYYTTEYNVYYLEIATGAQRDDYFLLKSSDDDNGFFNFLASVSGSVVGAIIGPGFIEGVLGGLIVTGVVSFFDDVENDFNDSLTELYQSLENSKSESGIAYIERTYYTNKEGFHTSPIYVDCYYIEWKG